MIRQIDDSGLQKNLSQNPKRTCFLLFLAQNFFGGLNIKSAYYFICVIHIYIDSENFDKFIEKCWSRGFGDCHFGKMGF